MKKFNIERMPKTFRKGSNIFVFCMLIVSILWFLIFYLAVNFNSILMGFKTVIGVDDYGGAIFEYSLKNYEILLKELATPDGLIRTSLINTLKYFCLNFFIMIPSTYFVSYFLYKKIAGYKFFRVIFYAPSIISSVAMVIIYKNVIGGNGPIDVVYSLFTGKEMPAVPPFLSLDQYITPTIMLYTFWTGFGVNIVLYQGAMGRIPEEILESAKIDGVTWFKELFVIITPLVWSTISMTLIVSMTGLFTAGGPIMLFGTPEVSYTISYYIFTQVHDSGIFYYPASMGIFFTIVSLPIVLGFRFMMNKLDPKVEY